jgi:hypothetical protein
MSFPPPPPEQVLSKTRPSVVSKYATYILITGVIIIILAAIDFFIWDPPANYIIGVIFVLFGVFFLIASFAFYAGKSWALTVSGYSNRSWAQTQEVRAFFGLPLTNLGTFQTVPVSAAPPPPPQSLCPTCGQPLTYVQQYNRWYCQNENKYV